MPLKRAEQLELEDAKYARSWAEHSHSLETGKIYGAAAQMLSPVSGIHVDLGSGLGQLLFELKYQNPQATVIGVDNNRHLVKGSAMILERSGIPAVEGGKIIDREAVDGVVVQQYRRNRRVRPREVLRRGQASIIADDIRQMRVIKEILGDKKIDSGSLTFPGSSVRSAVEKVADFHALSDQEVFTRQQQIMQRVRAAAGQFFTERVRRGGKVLIAERVGIDEGASLEEVIAYNLRQIFTDNHTKWDFDGVRQFSAGGSYSPTVGANQMITHSMHQDSGIELSTTASTAPTNPTMYIVMSTWKKR